MDEEDGHPENGIHTVKDSDRQQRLRLCVLNEIVNTERDYVRTLLFLQSAFLHRIRQTADDQQCLSPEHVKILFSNIEDILELHKEVLSAVEAGLQPEPQPQHALGHIFLQFLCILPCQHLPTSLHLSGSVCTAISSTLLRPSLLTPPPFSQLPSV
ncbi:phosphatidylinositol 3,4,5-trisphosphate-dependent Rac exchanger 1 protein-like [Gouania willdenowi]|uniref:phosphatidylinositol 3,4,5-trisphosphate-dependent Rac exchanger 1 protein-like n=1 Tax=Gouania willdenowi TaxID=441366 RepID=UPI001055E95E|nr:phosphatidylinositol 3,4,5-trisphosphate-dependent Rac exchanger 1 protein-like [Gouania willdenowi]